MSNCPTQLKELYLSGLISWQELCNSVAANGWRMDKPNDHWRIIGGQGGNKWVQVIR